MARMTQTDYVSNILVENVKVLRLPSRVQPNMNHGIYFKAWDGPISGTPPTGGGGGFGTRFTPRKSEDAHLSYRWIGFVKNAIFRNFIFDRVQTAFQIVQNFGAPSCVIPHPPPRLEESRGTD